MPSAREQIEKLVSDAEAQIRSTRELIEIMEMAGEDLTDEKAAIADLTARVARYRAALAGIRG